MTLFRVHLIYEDVFEEEAETLEEAEQRVRECFAENHNPFILGNEPKVFGYQYAEPDKVHP